MSRPSCIFQKLHEPPWWLQKGRRRSLSRSALLHARGIQQCCDFGSGRTAQSITKTLGLLERTCVLSPRLPSTTMTTPIPITNTYLWSSEVALLKHFHAPYAPFEPRPLHCFPRYFVSSRVLFKQGSTRVKRCSLFLNHLPKHGSCFLLWCIVLSQASYSCRLSVS